MRLLEKILIATDFSPGANAALNAARVVAKQFHSEVILLHVIPGTVDFCTQQDTIGENIREGLRGAVHRLRTDGIEVVDAVVEKGIPFEQINRVADARNVNVVFIGACKTVESGLSLGTTAAQLHCHALQPIWMVNPARLPEIRQILCPVDFSEPAGRALKNAIHLARSLQARLTVLTVLPNASMYSRQWGGVPKDVRRTQLQQQLLQLDTFLRAYDLHGVKWRKMVLTGDPAGEILKAIRVSQSDLLVIGTAGRTGFSQFLRGSVSRKVARGMPCSIVTLKSEDAVRLRLDDGISDSSARVRQAHELLSRGFAREALNEFRDCVAREILNVPAMEGMAEAHERLGQRNEANKCRRRAEQITRTLSNRQIEADIRSRHPLFGKKRYHL